MNSLGQRPVTTQIPRIIENRDELKMGTRGSGSSGIDHYILVQASANDDLEDPESNLRVFKLQKPKADSSATSMYGGFKAKRIKSAASVLTPF